MRILRLRFQNLNSLTGSWEIDFTHPSFTGDGIFAITGPTGAGKTTILDALCLALYGRTPRLDKITKGSNEIMSRQSGECFAEVAFATGRGEYCAYWYQHRSRKKAGAALQPQKRELSELASGRIIASSLGRVEKEVEQLTGMDFDRFTRSMLLAQGGFAAFLQADQDERAPILEQITGSAIYSEISIAVFERHRSEQEKLRNLQEKAALLRLLSPEEKEDLEKNLTELGQEEVRVSKETALKKAALDWLTGLADLQKELTNIKGEQQALVLEEEAFAADAKRLRLAEQALVLEGDSATLSGYRNRQAEERKAVIDLQVKLPVQETEVTVAGRALAESRTVLEQCLQEQGQGNVLLKQVRAMDLRLVEKKKQVRLEQVQLAGLIKKNRAAQKNIEQLSRAVTGAATRLEKIKKYCRKHGADQQLVAELTGITSMFSRLSEFDRKHGKNRIALEKAEKRAVTGMAEWQQRVSDCAEADKRLLAGRREQQQLENAREKQLNGGSREELEQELRRRKEQFTLLSRLQEYGRARQRLGRELETLKAEQEKVACTSRELTADSKLFSRDKESRQREAALLRDQVTLANRVRDLEEERQQLQDNSPCPLCGALEHPYALGNVPAVDTLLNELKAAEKAAIRAGETLAEAREKLVRQDQAGKGLERQIRERQEAIRQAEEAGLEVEQELDPDFDRQHLRKPDSLSDLLVKLEKEIAGQRQQMDALTRQENKLVETGKALAGLQDIAARAARDQERAVSVREQADQERERLTGEGVSLQASLQEQQALVRKKLVPWGITRLSVDQLDTLLADLGKRRDQWLEQEKSRTVTEQEILSLQGQIRELQAAISSREEQVATLNQDIAEHGREEQELVGQRTVLFADKNPDQEEKKLADRAKQARKQLEKLQGEHGRLLNECDLSRAALQRLEKSISGRVDQLASLERAFGERLRKAGFVDEAAFIAACLAEKQRLLLAEQADRLRTRRTGLEERLKDRQARLEREEKRQLTTGSSAEELEKEYDGLRQSGREISGRIGSINQQLQNNDNVRKQQQSLLRNEADQERECGRWQQLNDLIGSAKGKKYRNFAQGLTFELMVNHANRQLAGMTDRYLLVRDTEQPLELNVIDSWQAGEVRSTKNLSGGESFVVSLALALGLANMVGGNVRVDSLFLDEGFGALDEDALETALETLAALRQEGKLIGVISHVGALKERISCQLEVVPLSGGRSRITGAGVRQIQ